MTSNELYQNSCKLTDDYEFLSTITSFLDAIDYMTKHKSDVDFNYFSASGQIEKLTSNLITIQKDILTISNAICPDDNQITAMEQSESEKH